MIPAKLVADSMGRIRVRIAAIGWFDEHQCFYCKCFWSLLVQIVCFRHPLTCGRGFPFIPTLFLVVAHFNLLSQRQIRAYSSGLLFGEILRKDGNFASACGSANGKVERRRRDGGNGAGAKRPSPNRRRKHADHSAFEDAARDERAFCGTEPAWS